jgi:hypothetical protein
VGVSKHSLEIIDKGVKCIKMPYEGLKMCEMGCMLFHKGVTRYKKSKSYYKDMGVKHISIDRSGKHKSVAIDLCFPIARWKGYFDIITDIGTGEHVNNQYMYFKNCHHLCRVGGVMVHRLPSEGHWQNRRIYHYDEDFIKKLAVLGGYKILFLEITHLASFILLKTKNDGFTKRGWLKGNLRRKVGKRI